jgi:hypothetical protein
MGMWESTGGSKGAIWGQCAFVAVSRVLLWHRKGSFITPDTHILYYVHTVIIWHVTPPIAVASCARYRRDIINEMLMLCMYVFPFILLS